MIHKNMQLQFSFQTKAAMFRGCRESSDPAAPTCNIQFDAVQFSSDNLELVFLSDFRVALMFGLCRRHVGESGGRWTASILP